MQIIKRNLEFQSVFQKGNWYGAEYLVIYVLQNDKDKNRVGIAVGKKIAKSVKRNRIRRVIREAYRLNENQIITGYDIVIVCKSGINMDDVHIQIIQKDLLKAMKKAKLLMEEI